MTNINRRTFALSAAAASRVAGASDRVVMGIIGCGGRGRYVGGFMKDVGGATFAACADVHLGSAEQAKTWAGGSAEAYQDFRRVLDRKDIDAVLISTPDHWHASIGVLACQAGKHIYVEKPLTHSIHEGRVLAEAAKKSGKICQSGTQHRSSPHFAEAAQMVQGGAIGKLHFVRVWNYVNIFPNGIGKEPDTAPPEGLNWEMYCGPAPLVPYNRKRWKATFRYFRDYSGGYITDYGTHRFDTVHQITGVDTPLSACANGGRYVLQDAGDTPDVMQVTYEYPGFVLSYESSLLSGYGIGGRSPGMKYYNARGPYDRPNGMAFYGTNGVLMADRVGFEVFPDLKQGSASEFRMERTSKNTTDATSLHAAAFVNAVREGKPPVADILVGHRAVTVPHLGNISLKVGRKVKWDSAKEQIVGDAEASKLLFRAPRKPYDIIK